jgi:hypothetical protein
MHPQRLPNAQIQHDLLAATRNSIGPDISIQSLDLATLSSTAITQAAENLAGLAGTVLERGGGLSLQAGNSAAQLQRGLHIAHVLCLVDQILQPRPRRFDLASHVRELESDDWVVDQALSKGLALVRILHALFVADASEAQTLDHDADALVVEVGHDDAEALVLFAEQVLDGHLDVFEGDVRRAGRPDALAVHSAGADAGPALDQQDGHSVHAGLAGAYGCREIVGPYAVCDPFLLAVDNVVFTVLAELGLAADVGDVRARICNPIVRTLLRAAWVRRLTWFSDSQTDALVASQDTWHNPVDQLFLAVM